ncbi:cytidine deaminase-like protein [Amylocarpus encephaloides]|uniref:Cytidine deaminase-like protein n=1 Tax=Amylocarpus encephaloides TaxID=45428 RepID=A0A9P7Y8Y3_9HELO|nr:cytidine deaminase-like protein [Amylocarpus encephaloides]
MSSRNMSSDEHALHATYMNEALAMASHALSTSETPVGCILVHPLHSILARGLNATNRTRNGTMHAEFIAISSLLTSSLPGSLKTQTWKARADMLRECTLYVTVEPCIMCASLLRQFGIRRVFYGASNEKFGGTGGVLDVHRGNGKMLSALGTSSGRDEVSEGRDGEEEKEREEGDYEVSGGWGREEAIVLLRRFYVQENGRAPEPRKKGERVLRLDVAPLGEGVSS